MKRSLLTSRSLCCLIYAAFCLCITACASQPAADTPIHAVDDALLSDQADELLVQTLTEKKQKPHTEILVVDSAIALRQNGTWTFSPDFVQIPSPDAALLSLERAILENNADAFCQNLKNADACKSLFAQNTTLFSDAYMADTGIHDWKQTTRGLFINLPPLRFYFELNQGNWHFSGFCQIHSHGAEGFPGCP